MFSAVEAIAWIGLGFVLAGSLFYPLAALLVVVKAFKGS